MYLQGMEFWQGEGIGWNFLYACVLKDSENIIIKIINVFGLIEAECIRCVCGNCMFLKKCTFEEEFE